jgi:hypothetical protein
LSGPRNGSSPPTLRKYILSVASHPLPISAFYCCDTYSNAHSHRILLISFVNSLQQQTNFSWRPYVTSAFKMHGLTAITDIVANIVGGVSKLPLAKFIDIVGRPQGFLLCLMFLVACKYIQSSSPRALAKRHRAQPKELEKETHSESSAIIALADHCLYSTHSHGPM